MNQDRINAVLLFLAFAVIYHASSFTYVPFGDASIFLVGLEKTGYESKIAALSYYWFHNTAALIKHLFPTLSAPEVFKWITILSSATCIILIYNILKYHIKNSFISVLLSICFGFSYSFWRNASDLELYTFNLVWVLCFFGHAFKAYFEGSNINYAMASIILGLSLGSHLQNIFFIPSLFFLAFRAQAIKSKLYCLVPFISIFALILLNNYSQGVSLSDMFLSKSDWVTGTFTKSLLQYLKDLGLAIGYLVYNFWLMLIFAFLGLNIMYKKDKSYFFFWISMSVFTWGFAIFYNVKDNFTYFLPAYVLLLVPMAESLNKIIYNKKHTILITSVILFFPLYYVLSYQMAIAIPSINQFDQKKSYKGGLKYYLYPWLRNNVGVIRFSIENKAHYDGTEHMVNGAKDYIKSVEHKYTVEELKEQ